MVYNQNFILFSGQRVRKIRFLINQAKFTDYPSASFLFLASRKCMKWQLKMHTYTCQIPWLTLRD